MQTEPPPTFISTSTNYLSLGPTLAHLSVFSDPAQSAHRLRHGPPRNKMNNVRLIRHPQVNARGEAITAWNCPIVYSKQK